VSGHPLDGHWPVTCPAIFLDREAQRLDARLARRAGVRPEWLRDEVVAKFLRRHGVQLVLGEYLDQFVDLVPLLDRLGMPYIVQGHGIDVSAALRQPCMAQRYRSYRSAKYVLTRCELHRRRLIDLGLSADKVVVNPGGVDIPSPAPEWTPGAEKRFLAIGRMTAKKGPIYLLEAFRQAAATDPGISLDYIGGGALEAAVRQYLDAAGLHARVRLHGPAPEAVKAALLASCGVYLQHSLTDPDTGDEEGLPAALQEAMAHSRAVIATRHSGIAEAVEDGRTGRLCEERDVQGMAQAITGLAGDGDTARRLGAAGRQKAERLYSWPAERDRLRACIEDA
jgi:glycosyltransferase involved in cell wall biosynthesis